MIYYEFFVVQTGLRPVSNRSEPRPVLTGLVTAKDRPRPVHTSSVRSFRQYKIWKTGLGLGLRPLGPKNRTGPDFQTLVSRPHHMRYRVRPAKAQDH
jgi:hypothetical protein